MSSIDDSTNLARTISYNLDQNTQWDKAAASIGGKLDGAEENLIKAFSYSDEKDSGFKEFAKQMGMDPDRATVQGLQLKLQMKYDRVKQAFTLLSNILFGKKEAEQAIIDKIGR